LIDPIGFGRKPTLYICEIPLRILFLSPVFNRQPERGRRTIESSKREMVFFGERKKNDGFVLKRKKQEN